MELKLKYEFTEGEVNYLIGAVDKLTVQGVQAASDLLTMIQKLRTPVNKAEFDKATAEKITGQQIITKVENQAINRKELDNLKKGIMPKPGQEKVIHKQG